MRRLVMVGALLAAAAAPAAAQDTTAAPPEGVRVVLRYTPGERPVLIVVPGPGLDSARAILRRDLDQSDRFETVVTPEGTAAASVEVNYPLYRQLGGAFALQASGTPRGMLVRLHDLRAERALNEMEVALPAPDAAGYRLAVHRVSDEVLRWITGTPGFASTRVAYVVEGRVRVVDADGFGDVPVTPDGRRALSPAWSPDGLRLAYTDFREGRGPVLVRDLATGQEQQVPGTGDALNITPGWTPDGRTIAFAKVDEGGTNIWTANVAEQCCATRLTVGRFADNLSPTYAPDGRRLAFISTRAGSPQVYVMAADGTDPEVLVPFDFGATGESNAPEWSPDGGSIIFHRDVRDGGRQLFVMDVASRRLKQLTSAGRNEDAAWAPDGRHIVFVSDRSGRRQLWVLDVESGRIRQLTFGGNARLPSWSRRPAAP
ncbi:MAG: DPP IV N-terminal domain-containing protein [Gemmatimonadales bacterium]|nr:DPP IV N-terminal domain-containing protein [Gemmatimonadales bacterium]